MTEPQVAFTGDTTSDFIVDNSNIDVLKARILVMEVDSLFIFHFLCFLCIGLCFVICVSLVEAVYFLQ